MSTHEFTFDRNRIDAFIRFGYELYQNDTSWIPPFRKSLYAWFSPEFSFYRQQGNRHIHFLAISRGKVLGRVSAMVNKDLKHKDGGAVGIIGFFECIQDPGVAEELLGRAKEWLANQKMTQIWGPMNFDIWHGYRLMTRGFHSKLFVGEPYNKPYYADYFEHNGFKPLQHWISVELTGFPVLDALGARHIDRFRDLIELGYRFEPFNVRSYSDELKKLHALITKSFSGFLGFTSISFSEFENLYAPLRYALDPRLFVFAYDERHLPVGFAGAILERSEAIRAMKGNSGVLAKMKFLLHPHTERAMFYVLGITPEEAEKRKGLGRALFSYIFREAVQVGLNTLIYALTPKTGRSHALLEEYSADERREYVLYEIKR